MHEPRMLAREVVERPAAAEKEAVDDVRRLALGDGTD
jgi:hypothetical protein